MKIAIIFAAYINDEVYLPMFEQILHVFRAEMNTGKFYVGINSCKYQNHIIERFHDSGLDYIAAITPPEMELKSDASAYHTALKLLQNDIQSFDYYWFSHTKGATSHSYDDLAAQLIELYLKKENVLQTFLSNNDYGLYATSGTVSPRPNSNLDPYMRFRHPPLPASPLYSFYVIRGSLVLNFLNNCSELFFTNKIPSRYFFEFDFPQVAFRQGKIPFFKQIVQVHHGDLKHITSNQKTYALTLKQWRMKNKI